MSATPDPQGRDGARPRYARDATPLLAPDEERAVTRRVREGDRGARDHLIRANVGLVVKIAVGYAGRGLPLEDLIGEGHLGLIRAADRFDPERGVRFGTYAGYWIRQAIGEALSTQSRTIRLPHNFDRVEFPRWRRREAELANRLGRKPTAGEVEAALGLKPGKAAIVRLAFMAAARPERLEAHSALA